MNKPMPAIVASAATFVVLVAGWMALPSLQDVRNIVSSDAAVDVERARRLLHQYDDGLTYRSLLTDQLIEDGIEVDADDPSEEMIDEYQRSHEVLWASYQPVNLPESWAGEVPQKSQANYGNLSAQMRQGLREQDNLAEDNARLLDDAMAAIQQALAVTHGDESSRTYAEANRLKAVILHYMGVAEWMQARLIRRQSDQFRSELIALIPEVAAAAPTRTLVADSTVDAQIATLNTELAKTRSAQAGFSRELADADGRIRDLQARYDGALARADQAREILERIRAKGADLSDPNGTATFQVRIEEQDRAYREASWTARRLEVGCFPQASLDRAGDYVDGHYLENGSSTDLTVEFGLAHYRHTRATVAAKIASQQGVMEDLRAALARLESSKTGYEAIQTQSAERLANVAEAAEEVYAELNRVESEAFAFEETALNKLEQAAKAARQASNDASSWTAEAHDKTRALSDEAKENSPYQLRIGDEWMSGHLGAQEADARLAKAWIHYDRFLSASRTVSVLGLVVKTIELGEVDLEAEQVKIDEAKDDGIDEITQAREVLDQNQRKAEGHWTFAAQAAGTTYLMTLFGHDDYRADTIAAYRNAVRGREGQPLAAPFERRLKRLENQ